MRGFCQILTGCLGVALAAVVFADSVNTRAQAPITVEMKTTLGEIVVRLEPGAAPITVANFLRYVDGGHYDGATFYRTVRADNDRGSPKIEVIQGGLGEKTVFNPIAHEDTEMTGLLHQNGTLSMARGDVGTASSEFFIVIGDQPGLDKGGNRNPDQEGFAAFGLVIEGMDVVHRIHQRRSDAPSASEYTADQLLNQPVVIASIRRLGTP